jgi:ABC-type dipeptide/oligopeptide/nickel transport system permease component
MIGYALRRLAGLLVVWLVAVVVTFVAVQFVPGDPILAMLSDRSGDAELEARLRSAYGLDRPLVAQFLDYLRHILDGTFGMSFRYVNTPVSEVIATGLRISPVLALSAITIAVPLGVMLGVLSARRANSWTDTAVILALVAGISVPNFAMAAFMVYILAVKWSVLPVAGWGSASNLVMPVAILVIPPTAYIARLTRTFMLEVLQQDFIRTARAKGLRERLVIYRHALRNTFVPLLTSVGIIFGGLLSGTFVVETIFNIPGLGRLAIDSIFARDYPVTMTIVLLFTVFYSLINLGVDLAYAALDPRIRLGRGRG